MGLDMRASTCDHQNYGDTKFEYQEKNEQIIEDNDEINFSHFGFC